MEKKWSIVGNANVFSPFVPFPPPHFLCFFYSITLLNAKKETKKVEFVDVHQSTLDQSERQLDSADSIGKEMTHFKPIRLMPLSAIYM